MTNDARGLLGFIRDSLDTNRYRETHWTGTFEDYLNLFLKSPRLARNAYQRVYDMVLSYGMDEYREHKQRQLRYSFFSDPDNGGRDAVYGLDRSLMQLVDVFKSAAHGYGTERRVLLLHGPVGSAKSTIVRMLKRGVERYSRTEDGALYTFAWREPESDPDNPVWTKSPMHEEPLYLIPKATRDKILADVNQKLAAKDRITLDGDLCPYSRHLFNLYMARYDGDWMKVIENVRVERVTLSEQDRIGIGTFQPKDEKNQDSTELTGDINYRKIAEYGTDSDPRAFNFDGEFNVANRGIIEFIEVLKLDVAFLYDLLGASQEHKIKPKKFAQTHIDEVIIGHTNEPEYRKLQNNEFMEALRDRTVKIDIPYVTRLDDEIRIYQKDFNNDVIKGKHIAPHTLRVASMWSVLSRLEEPKRAKMTLLQKAKLYDGKMLPGYTEDSVKELRAEAPNEGMRGISPRYIQDKISNALVAETGSSCLNPFMVMNELESGLEHHSLITNEEERKRYRELLAVVKAEYEDIIKNEVQRAISADEASINRLCGNYIDNVKAYTLKEKVRNKYTGHDEDPDERLMRSIEEKIDIPESRKDDFRSEIMNYIGALAIEGRTFNYSTNARLQKALELKLFEDQKDSIKLTSLVSSVVDKHTQEKIDIIKARLIKNYGYSDEGATDVLNYVASIFARGDVKNS